MTSRSLISRRGFLRLAGVGAVGVSCYPGDFGFTGLAAAQTSLPDLRSLWGAPDKANLMLGYPINMNLPPDEFFQWRKQLFDTGVDQISFNNVGNPYLPSPIPFNTHALEREVIARFAKLYGIDPKEVWGFISHSGTDSNMHGMYIGRTILKHRTGRMPKAYFTKEAHYSIQILRDLLGLDWVEVAAHADGSMDVSSLADQLSKHPNDPALVVATVGTTFKGAIDPLDEIRSLLKGREAFLHVDAALFGGYLPHTQFADELRFTIAPDPTGKTTSRYDALAVSCHKFFGFPAPAGLFMTTRRLFEEFLQAFEKVHSPEYIHQVPGTITCSRDAVKPAEFYFFSSESAFARQAQDARQILENTDYLLRELNNHFPSLRPSRSNNRSNTVYFRKPGQAIVKRYSLATMELLVDGKREPYAHVVVMPHVTKKVLDQFLEDLHRDQKT
ncbi:MAG: aminotransferase class V-fold PLP-dependent enzyme [Thermoguttaceae bacterium]|nr:aminotransferase class V-fold PLP-dependent enzyme [Thermoguttaceae bacterium]MDW8037363.1 aminotransferase class V-fold PLP-dependent enzyme [Thermoguttaceae bacterium]